MLRLPLRWLLRFVLVAVVIPVLLGAALSYARGWPESWRNARWESSGLLPQASDVPEARVMVIAARTGRWKSIFAEHTAIVLKPEGASDWTRYDVVGWGNPVRRNAYAADAHWYGNRPYVVGEVRGARAAALIPRIEAAIAAYPHQRRGSYTVWPGPNSNTFVAWVVRNSEGFGIETAPGGGRQGLSRDGCRRGTGAPVARASWCRSPGVLGLTLALKEGLELNLLGSSHRHRSG